MPRRVLYAGAVIAADPASFAHLGGGFARDGTRVWFCGSVVAGVDPARLHVLAGGYATDGEHVVCRDRVVVGAHAPSFELLDVDGAMAIARDRERLYADEEPADGPDPATLVVLGAGLAADRNAVWRVHPAYEPRFQRIEADRASLRIVDEDHACDRERAWYRGQRLDGAVAAAFATLGHGYATDGVRVYRENQALVDVIATGFRPIDRWYAIAGDVVCSWAPIEGADPATLRSLGFNFCADAARVYFEAEPIAGADPATFALVAMVGDRGWARDRAHVWYREHVWYDHGDFELLTAIAAEPDAIEVIDEVYARAGDCVLRGTGEFDGADAASFRVLGGGWERDATTLWFGDRRLASAAPDSIEIHGDYAIAQLAESAVRVLGDGFAATAETMLFAGCTIEGPTPTGARSLGGGYLVDARGAWFFELATESRKMPDYVASGGALPGADPATLRRDGAFAIDRTSVFAGTHRLDADPAAFRAIGTRHGSDGKAAYHEAQRIACEPSQLRVLDAVLRTGRNRLADAGDVSEAWATNGDTLFVCGRELLDDRGRYIPPSGRERLARFAVARMRLLDRWFATDGDDILDMTGGFINEAADAASFVSLGDGYARDRGGIWYVSSRVYGGQRDAVRVLGDRYATDGRRVWWRGYEVVDPDGELVPLGGSWARDRRGIICGAIRVAADPETFVVVGRADAAEAEWDGGQLAVVDPLWQSAAIAVGRDRRALWWGPHEVPATAVVVGHGYAISDTAVTYAGQAIDADAATFDALGDGYARDAHRLYYQGRVTR